MSGVKDLLGANARSLALNNANFYMSKPFPDLLFVRLFVCTYCLIIRLVLSDGCWICHWRLCPDECEANALWGAAEIMVVVMQRLFKTYY